MKKHTPKNERLKRYMAELDRAQAWRQNEGFDQLWKTLIGLYGSKGVFPTVGQTSDEDRIAINLAFSTVNVIYPSVSVANPKISVLGTRPDNEDKAVFNQAILNYQWEHFGFHDPFRAAVKDMVIVGHGWVKTTWQFEEREADLTDDEFNEQFADQASQADTARNDGTQGVPSDDQIAASIPSTKTIVASDQPTLDRLSVFDVYVNPEATSTRDMRWICQRVIRNVDEIHEDQAYEAAPRKAVAAGLQRIASHDPRFGHQNLDPDLAEVWEFYDLVRGEMCVFAEGAKGFLVKPQRIPYAFGHPFEMVGNYEVPDQFYPIGDLEMIAPLMQELSKTRSEMMNHRSKYARKWVARKSAFARNDVAKITSKRDGEVIMVEDDSVPLDDVIKPLPQIPMDAGLYAWSDRIMQDAQEISGISEYARGVSGDIRRTATEASLIQQGTNARLADKLDRVEKFIARIARKLLQINQQFLTGDQVARIVGREGQMVWLPYTRDDIMGEFDFSVEAGSTAPKDENGRRQSAMALGNIAMPFMQLGIVNPSEVFRYILREGFGIRSPERFLQQQPQQPQAGPGGQPPPGRPSPGTGADAPQNNPTQQADANAANANQTPQMAIGR